MRYTRTIVYLFCCAGSISCAPQTQTSERNAFLTLAETFGAPAENRNDNTSGGGGTDVNGETDFRGTMSVIFANNNRAAELNTSLIAWVNVSSIRSADQQDALLRAGYVQLTSEVKLGTAFTLPPGTFVFNGPGVAGASSITLNEASAAAATTQTVSLVTPDVLLVFSQPPVSCDSVAFYYTVDGDIPTSGSAPGKGAVILFSGATGNGFLKTLAQVQTYQCDPLNPGFFLKLGGGIRKSNEFFEGQEIRIDFRATPDADGNFATVTIS